MKKITSNFCTGILATGTAATEQMLGAVLPLTVWVVPAAGDTITVTYSVNNGTTYNPWPSGAVTAAAEWVCTFPITHIKFQRTVGAGTTSAYGVM